jgi:adenylate cyclase
LKPFQAIRAAAVHANTSFAIAQDAQGNAIAAAAPVPGPDWTVVVEQPLSEAFQPIYAALWRTAGLLLAGSTLAGLLAFCARAPNDEADPPA